MLSAVPLSQTAPHSHGGKQDCSNGNCNGCAGRGSSSDSGGSSVQGAGGGNGVASNNKLLVYMKSINQSIRVGDGGLSGRGTA